MEFFSCHSSICEKILVSLTCSLSVFELQILCRKVNTVVLHFCTQNWMTYCSHFLPHSTCQKVAIFVYKMCFCVTYRAFHTTTWRGLYCIHCFQNGIFCTKSYLDLFSVNQVILEWGCWPSKARMTVNVSMITRSSFSFVTNNNVHSYSCYVWSLQCGTFTSACLLRQKWTAWEWWCPWHTRACCESNLSK